MSRTAPTRRPIWAKIPAEFVRSCLAGHSAIGLSLAALCYLICVTGTLVVFADELRRWEQPGVPESRAISQPAVRAAADAAVGRAGDKTIGFLSITLPRPDFPRTSVSVTGKDLSEAWYVAPDGTLATEKAAPWTEFAVLLHMKLHMPGLWGYLVVGMAGVAMLALAITGLLAHPRIFRDAFTLRWGGSKRLQEADLHNRLSVWGLPFNVVLSVTGAWFGLVGLLVAAVADIGYDGDRAQAAAAVRPPAVAPDERPAPRLDIAAAVARAEAQPGMDRAFSASLSRPGAAGQSITVYSTVEDRLVYGEIHPFTADDQAPTEVGWSSGPFGAQLYASTYTLHFGDFGGLPVKLLYFALGFALCVVCSSGVAIWLARRRDRGKPAPFWERMWAATAWGQPIALVVAAVAAITFQANALMVFCAVIVASYPLAALAPDAKRLADAMRLFLGTGLAALVAAHLIVNGTAALTPVPAVVDGILLIIAAGLVAWTLFLPNPRTQRAKPPGLAA